MKVEKTKRSFTVTILDELVEKLLRAFTVTITQFLGSEEK
jgi:hypothetical protein